MIHVFASSKWAFGCSFCLVVKLSLVWPLEIVPLGSLDSFGTSVVEISKEDRRDLEEGRKLLEAMHLDHCLYQWKFYSSSCLANVIIDCTLTIDFIKQLISIVISDYWFQTTHMFQKVDFIWFICSDDYFGRVFCFKQLSMSDNWLQTIHLSQISFS